MIKISKRLESLAKYVTSNDRIMDVGCDHALLDIYLVDREYIKKIYVCDVNPNALQNGIANIEKYDMDKKVIPVLGYGIERINEFDVNTLIISGMGSKNIVEILSSPNVKKIYKLILQSNNNHYELRKFLMDEQFSIVDEEIVEDGKKSYINIVALRDYYAPKYTEVELEFGPILMGRIENISYFEDLLAKSKAIFEKNKTEAMKTRIAELETIISSLANG